MSEEKKTNGALIGIIIILLILVIGAIYFWKSSVREVFNREITEETLQIDGAELDNLETDLESLLKELDRNND